MKVFGLFDHDFILTLPWLTGFLWAAGGGGPKWMRRFGVPLAITAYAVAYGMTLFQTLYILPFSLLVGFGPGYGDKYVKDFGSWYWPYIVLLGFLWGVSQFGLCFVFGGWARLIFGAGLCAFTFAWSMGLSKRAGLEWKIAEGLTGAAVGAIGALIIH